MSSLFSTSKFARLAALLLALCACFHDRARAEAVNIPGVQVDSRSGIDLRISSCFKELTPAGFATLQIYIHNTSGQPRTWQFTFNSTSIGEDRFESNRDVTVPDNTEQTFEVLVPLPASTNPSYSYFTTNLQISVSGYGIVNNTAGMNTSYSTGRNLTDFILMSQALQVHSWGPLDQACTNQGLELAGSEFDPNYLPTDWRGYIGAGSLWITESEYHDLDPAPRNALREWILQGGTLVICTTSPHKQSDFGFQDEHPGYGHVKIVQWDGHELETFKVIPLITTRDHSLAANIANGYESRWDLANAVGHLIFNGWFIMLFVIGFGLVIGPVNLFRFAKSGRRHRLFWTTPLISIAGSVLLALVIVLQDGFGGSGRRLVLVELMPGDNDAIVTQEQVSRTGLLLSTRFDTEDKIFISPITNIVRPTGSYSTAAIKSKARTYVMDGKACSGDWFASRSVQAQLIQVIRPSRSRVEITAGTGGGAPSLLSSIENDLDRVFYIDADGKYWQSGGIAVGQKKTMTPATERDFDEWFASNTDAAGARITYQLGQSTKRRGYFYAVANEAGKDAVPTMPSIHWGDSKTIYLGPCAGDTGAVNP